MKRKDVLSMFAVLGLVVAVASAFAQDGPPSADSDRSVQTTDVFRAVPDDLKSTSETRSLSGFKVATIPDAPPADVTQPARTERRVIFQDADPQFVRRPTFSTDATPLFRTHVSGPEGELVANTNKLVQELAKAESEPQRQELRTKLTEVLSKQFDSRQTRQAKEVEALEAQVKKLKELIKKREDNRSEIISRRLDQLVRDSQGLGF